MKNFGYPFDKPIESFDSVLDIMRHDGASSTDIELVEYLIERIKRQEAQQLLQLDSPLAHKLSKC